MSKIDNNVVELDKWRRKHAKTSFSIDDATKMDGDSLSQMLAIIDQFITLWSRWEKEYPKVYESCNEVTSCTIIEKHSDPRGAIPYSSISPLKNGSQISAFKELRSNLLKRLEYSANITEVILLVYIGFKYYLLSCSECSNSIANNLRLHRIDRRAFIKLVGFGFKDIKHQLFTYNRITDEMYALYHRYQQDDLIDQLCIPNVDPAGYQYRYTHL